jgi:hypothetical protein
MNAKPIQFLRCKTQHYIIAPGFWCQISKLFLF